MELRIEGGGAVTLTQAEFVGQGGEGAVYARGDRAFKVYTAPGRVIPPLKIAELAVLSHPAIIRPLELLLDEKGQPIGYTMRRVRDAHPLCRLFTRAFRERMGLSADRMEALVRRLQEGVRHVHERGILIVDLNEMNFLVDAGLREVLFIDVDSYQTPSFPATALMESVRDRHASTFSEATDWFSFGVVSFQMFTGIHPYRGKHPTLPDLDARMRANVSVLNGDVSLPGACYPLTVIPPAYLEWYRALFEDGKRLPPPAASRGAVFAPSFAAAAPAGEGGSLRVEEIHRFPADVVQPVPLAGAAAALTVDGLFVGRRRHPVPAHARMAFTPRERRLVSGWIEDETLRLYDTAEGRTVPTDLRAEALTSYGGTLYLRSGDSLYEVELLELPAGPRPALRPAGNVLENATELYDGVAVQSLLGACYVSLFPRPGSCRQVHLKELDGARVVDARFDGGVLMLLAAREGRYDRWTFRFDPRCAAYDARVARDVACAGLDFVTLDTGLCLHLNEAGELEVFPAAKGGEGMRVIRDAALQGGRLFRDGAQALLARGETVYKVSSRVS